MHPKLVEAINRDDVKRLAAARADAPLAALLSHAAARGATKCLAVLLAEPRAREAARAQSAVTLDTPLHHARTAAIAKALLDVGANVDARTSKRETPLHRAAALGRADVIPVLLDAGAVVDALDADGRTPLMAALRHTHAEAVERLVERGARVDLSDAAGRTTLELLEAGGKTSDRARIVERLLDAGADPTAAMVSSALVRQVAEGRRPTRPRSKKRPVKPKRPTRKR